MPNIVYQLPVVTARPVSIEDDFYSVKNFQSREGVVKLVASKRTGRLRIIKIVEHHDRHKYPAEAKALARIRLVDGSTHPNIIKLLQCEYNPRLNFGLMLFEHCSGGDLCQQLMRRRADPLFALHIFISLGEALAFLHHGLVYNGGGDYRETAHEPLIHLDIKDDNCFLRWGNEKTGGGLPDVVLADYGLADTPSRAQPGRACIPFMSPESHSGRRGDLTTRTDVYSFAVMMHRILDHTTGSDGFWPMGKNPAGLCLDVTYKGLGFTDVLRKCLAYKPSERGDFSLSSRSGMLSSIVDFRMKRRAMIDRGDRIPSSYWVSKP